MTLLFTILVVLGFFAMLCAHIPRLGLQQWVPWALWTAAAFIWAIPQLG